ncbi:helix-turn-helix domain-containing protein [Planosporangium mesophilum]|uniref:Transcriptional regulator n=1 Tax=Planosporangium mesophilum TaxID=689768 RepID=A0A8J3TG79_9ACTN|nr:helix-turn-helix transcriptional regulator [Planosporangium mesophilum]NJC84830.1 helix-turn-helix domain-containing protein [Planosporangium mesophilum]GII24149.1 transcriptional regulator [Planosporangium mesophilum]
MVDGGSSVPRRQLGRYLKKVREEAGVALEAAANELEWSRARMYRIEGGQTAVRSHDVVAMCALYGVSNEMTEVLVGLAKESKAKGWWHARGDAVPAHLHLYFGLEAAASRMRQYQAVLVPGLLQTQEYAEAVFRTRLGTTEEEVAQRVAVRSERQRLLARRRPKAPELRTIVDEAVLRRPIADRAAMQRQLAHLVDVSQKPGISVRVLPLEVGPHPASAAADFTILEFPRVGNRPPEPTTVYSENLTGSHYLDKPGEVAAFEEVWQALDSLALDTRESEDLIGTIIKETGDD